MKLLIDENLPNTHCGLIIVRLPKSFITAQLVASIVRLISNHPENTFFDTTTILETNRIRRRKL
ncbi:hypothetical protein HY641_03565 [Candidatus Woesearchaeota archaeon]|nr:hypothetical protein [Candidatus Woesearchaeota archaeon]